jgi:hypothetical protein
LIEVDEEVIVTPEPTPKPSPAPIEITPEVRIY